MDPYLQPRTLRPSYLLRVRRETEPLHQTTAHHTLRLPYVKSRRISRNTISIAQTRLGTTPCRADQTSGGGYMLSSIVIDHGHPVNYGAEDLTDTLFTFEALMY